MNLSPNFTLEELTHSDTATRLKLNNMPGEDRLDNLKKLALKLEEIRLMLGYPMLITSGYRSPALNRAVGGSATSSHAQGLAADFHCPKFGDVETVCRAISSSPIAFDQLIFEQAASHWVHIGIGEQMRRQVLSWTTKTGFRSGIVRL